MQHTDIIGQPSACENLTQLARADRLPSLLFAGPPGTGKRTTALWLARALNCPADDPPCNTCQSCKTLTHLNHPDIKLIFPIKVPKKVAQVDDMQAKIELVAEETIKHYEDYAADRAQPEPDSRHSISILQVRWLRRESARPPLLARRRFFIILHAHRMADPAANALLKTLEEPQKQTTIILTTDRPNQLLDTIRSRCRLIRFLPVPTDAIRDWLVDTRGAEPDTAALAAHISEGSFSRALSFIEDPEQLLTPPAIDFFALPQAGEDQVLEAAAKLDRIPLTTTVTTLAYLYQQALRAKHGLRSEYANLNPAVRSKAETCSDDYLRRVLRYLADRADDTRLNVNRKLFIYTLLSSLRRPTA